MRISGSIALQPGVAQAPPIYSKTVCNVSAEVRVCPAFSRDRISQQARAPARMDEPTAR
jgi:hypothetical protein